MQRKILAVLLIVAVLALGLPAAAMAGTSNIVVIGPTRTVTSGVVVVGPSRTSTSKVVVVGPSRTSTSRAVVVGSSRSTAPAKTVPTIVNLTVNPVLANLLPGQSVRISAVAIYSTGLRVDVTRNCAVYVSDNKVVSYSSCYLKALSPGTATVTVSGYGKTAQMVVNVINAPKSLSVDPANIKLQVGQEQDIKATLTYYDGSTKDVTNSSLYIISNSRVVSFSNGRIKALARGSATITVANSGKTARVYVTVTEAPKVTSITSTTTTSTASTAASSDVIKETYRWQYNGKTYTLNIDVPKDLYDWDRSIYNDTKKFYETDPYTRYQMLQSMPDYERKMVYACNLGCEANYVYWVNEPKNSAFMEKVGDALLDIARKENFNRFQTAEFALSFVQSIPYVVTEYPVLPVQTLVDRKGDCDVKSVLLASLLKRMGYDVALLYFDSSVTGKNEGHVAVGVAFSDDEVPTKIGKYWYSYRDKNYYFAETTAPLALGDSAVKWGARVYPV